MYIVMLSLLVAACAGPESGKEEQKEPEVKKVEEYYENGMLSKRGTTIDGKRSGLWESYYPNGLKWSETTFKYGYKEGPTTTFYPNGIMRYSGRYYSDERSGVWTFYDTTGVVAARIDMDVQPEKADSIIQHSPL